MNCFHGRKMFHASAQKSRLKCYLFFSDSVMRLVVWGVGECRKIRKRVAPAMMANPPQTNNRLPLVPPALSRGRLAALASVNEGFAGSVIETTAFVATG